MFRRSKRHVEIFKDTADQWRWRVVARNGEITAQSEAYTRRQSALRAAEREFPDYPIVERAR